MLLGYWIGSHLCVELLRALWLVFGPQRQLVRPCSSSTTYTCCIWGTFPIFPKPGYFLKTVYVDNITSQRIMTELNHVVHLNILSSARTMQKLK